MGNVRDFNRWKKANGKKYTKSEQLLAKGFLKEYESAVNRGVIETLMKVGRDVLLFLIKEEEKIKVIPQDSQLFIKLLQRWRIARQDFRPYTRTQSDLAEYLLSNEELRSKMAQIGDLTTVFNEVRQFLKETLTTKK